jgi:hypothetical protein
MPHLDNESLQVCNIENIPVCNWQGVVHHVQMGRIDFVAASPDGASSGVFRLPRP